MTRLRRESIVSVQQSIRFERSVLAMGLLLSVALVTVCPAQFTLTTDTPGKRTKLTPKQWNWVLANTAERFPASAAPGGTTAPSHSDGFWNVMVSSPAAAGGVKQLDFEINHRGVPNGHNADGENLFHLTIPGIARPAAAANPITHSVTWWDEHPGAVRHFDVIKAVVEVPAAGAATVSLSGPHARLNGGSAVRVKYKPLTDGSLTIFGSYPEPASPIGTAFGPEDVPARTRVRQTIPDQPVENEDGMVTMVNPTDFHIRFQGSPISDTSLSFVAQSTQPGGDFRQIPLWAGLDLSDAPEVTTPMLSNETLELFIGIDLSQWDASAPAFSELETYTFTAGVNGSLPGVLVGTSPITFDPAVGYVTDSPYSGDATVKGVIDAELVAIPEPSGALLAAIAFLGMGVFVRQRTWSASLAS